MVLAMSEAVCLTTAIEFERARKWSNHAGTDCVQSVYHSMPIESHHYEFMAGKRGVRDRQRMDAFAVAAEMHARSKRLLQFLVAILQARGCVGTITTEEVLACQVRKATGGAMSTRTFRRALSELRDFGFVSTALINTGNKVRAGGGWKMLQVNKITLTTIGRLIALKCAPGLEKKSSRPHRYPTSVHNSVDRPKRPTDGEKKQSHQVILEKLPGETSINTKKETTDTNLKRDASPAKEGRPTSAPQNAAHVKQQRRDNVDSVDKPAKKAVLALSGRKSRNQAPKTYAQARETFLYELTRHSAGDPDASEWRRIAELQTHPVYPPLLPMACDFDKYMMAWPERSWKERRRILRNDIIPALRAFCADLKQPNPKKLGPGVSDDVRRAARRQQSAFERLSARLQSLPEILLGCPAPEQLHDKVRKYNYQLSRIPSLLHGGQLRINDLSGQDVKIFRELADAFGIDDQKNFF